MTFSLSLKHQEFSPAVKHQASSPMLKHYACRPVLRHHASRPTLRHQASSPSLEHLAWLTIHVRNPEDLTELIYPSERSNQLGMFIPFSIVEERKLPTSSTRRSLSWSRRSDPKRVTSSVKRSLSWSRRVIYLSWSVKGS